MEIQRIYFIGIGGIGMSALARYFLHEGREIDVRFRTRPELPRNHLIPYQPHEPGQEHAARHD